MIVTLTINPTLDKSTTVPQLIPEKKLRCTEMIFEAGGGGINVSKAIKELGGYSLALFPAGGHNGHLIKEQMKRLDIDIMSLPVSGETRESIIVRETSTNKEYKLIMPGCTPTLNELDALLIKIRELSPSIDYFVLSGSIPSSIPDDIISDIISCLRKKNTKIIIDTSGKYLKKALYEGVFLIKPNMSELCALAGESYLDLNQVKDIARNLLMKSNSNSIVVSMGDAGAMLVTKDTSQTFPAIPVKKISTVGAGDSMIGGIVYMLSKGKGLEDAVPFGVACGTASTICSDRTLIKKEDVFHFYNQMPAAQKQL